MGYFGILIIILLIVCIGGLIGFLAMPRAGNDKIDAEENLEKPAALDSSAKLLQQIESNTRKTKDYTRRTHFWVRYIGFMFLIAACSMIIHKGCDF